MATYTLLQLVQDIASSMDSDEVNSIGDSVESLQLATVVKTAYFDLIARANRPEHFTLINLVGAQNPGTPVMMFLPPNVELIKWVKYNKLFNTVDIDNPSFTHDVNTDIVPSGTDTGPDLFQFAEVQYLDLTTFLNFMHAQRTDDPNVGSFPITTAAGTFDIIYRNDLAPNYYTTFDDNTVIFDSFDSSFETSLTDINSLCFAKLQIPWSMVDTFIPDLEDDQFPLLMNEAKSLAWAELKQTQHNIADRNARRGWTHTQAKKNAVVFPQQGFMELPYFGRK